MPTIEYTTSEGKKLRFNTEDLTNEQKNQIIDLIKKDEEKKQDQKLEAAAVQAWQSLKPEQRRLLETT